MLSEGLSLSFLSLPAYIFGEGGTGGLTEARGIETNPIYTGHSLAAIVSGHFLAAGNSLTAGWGGWRGER